MNDSDSFFRRGLVCVLSALFLLVAASRPARAQDQPVIPKDSIRVFAWGASKSAGLKTQYGWMPVFEFLLKGSVASGSVPWVEVTMPGEHLKFDCRTHAWQYLTAPTRYVAANCDEDAKGNHIVFFAGPVAFSIHLRNELQETESTLLTGKMKVGKANPSAQPPNFYVDEDWRLPIGYVFLMERGCPDCSLPTKGANLHAVMWVRGRSGGLEAHLFYQGNEVAQTQQCKAQQPSEEGGGYTGMVWWGLDCDFPVWDVKPNFSAEVSHVLSGNPGDYEIKVLAGGHLARSLKFSVAADGTLVDNGIASNNKLGDDRIIVPVKVIGTGDGEWDRTAWKTGAFYGNPLTGFTAPP